MIDSEVVLDGVRRMLRDEPRIDFERQAIGLAFANGELLISGEAGDIAAKRLAVRRAARAPFVTRVIDELRVRPTATMPDGEIRDLVRKSLVEEPMLAGCAIREPSRGRFRPVRAPATEMGRIDVRIESGAVALDGVVSTLGQKRLAGVLSWWVPGTRNVINNLAVEPPEDDSDEAITDAVRLVLDRDRAVPVGGFRVTVRNAVVVLDGAVSTRTEQAAAERDAWYVFGVNDVLNHLELKAS